MKAISFGKVVVDSAGTPVKFGRTKLDGSVAASDTSFVVDSSKPFSSGMVPFIAMIEDELVMVTAISNTTWTVVRGARGTAVAAHSDNADVVADEEFCGWHLSTVSGGTGLVYFGTTDVNADGTGVIYEFAPQAALSRDFRNFVGGDSGNPLTLTDYALDVENSGEGLYVTLWQR